MNQSTRWVYLFAAFLALAVSTATAQPLLDRVLDRVEQEVNGLAPDLPEGAVVEPVEPGYLGVVANNRDDQGRGVRVLQVAPNGPANGVIAKNDVIVSIDDNPINSMDEMARILSTLPAGARVAFGIQRGAAARTVTVTLGQRPPANERLFQNFGRQPENADNPLAPPPGANKPRLGVRTLPVSDDVRRQMGLPNREGAMIIAVTEGLPAARAGVPVGAVITQVNDQIVQSPEHLAELVARAAAQGELELGFVADGKPTKRLVVFGEPIRSAPQPQPFVAKKSPAAQLPAPSDEEPVLAGGDPHLDAIDRRMQQIEERLNRIEQLLKANADAK
jgi:S1-C subfamily serine protease